MATPRSSQTFCARCGLAKSGHGFLGGACSNFIQPGSKEAHEANGHSRSMTWMDPIERRRHPHVCGAIRCECVKHDTAVTPKKAKLALVEPSPNAMARDAAVALLKGTLGRRKYMPFAIRYDINAALVILEVIS